MAVTGLSRRVFKYWDARTLPGAKIRFSKILIFTWKRGFYHWQQVLSTVSPEVTGSLHFQENTCQIPTLNSSLSVHSSLKQKGYFMKKGASAHSSSVCTRARRQTAGTCVQRTAVPPSHRTGHGDEHGRGVRTWALVRSSGRRPPRAPGLLSAPPPSPC